MEKQQSILFGIHPLVELLKAKRRPVKVLYTTKPVPQAFGTIAKLLPKHVPIEYVSRERLTALAGTNDHQSVVAIVGDFPFRKKAFDPQRAPSLLLLDGMQDPRNLGALIRSAYCAAIDGVIITKKQGAPLNAVAIKASAGLAEHMEIMQAPTALAAVTELKKAGYHIYLAALGGVDARTVHFQEPLCLVIGSEGSGISPEIRTSGQAIMLAQRTADISYNASVAGGILLFMISSVNKKI